MIQQSAKDIANGRFRSTSTRLQRYSREEGPTVLEPSRELDAVANKVIGAALEVHKLLGPGFLESIYEEALAAELKLQNIRHEFQRPVRLFYKGHPVGEHRVDLLVEGMLVVELKAIEKFLPIHKAQLISYLKATSLSLGLLINFNERWLRDGVQRIVLT